MVHNPNVTGYTSIYHPETEKDINDELPLSPTQKHMPTLDLLYVKMISSIESSWYINIRSPKNRSRLRRVTMNHTWCKITRNTGYDYDMIWYNMIWYDIIWYDDMIYYDMIWSTQMVGYNIDTITQPYEMCNQHSVHIIYRLRSCRQYIV